MTNPPSRPSDGPVAYIGKALCDCGHPLHEHVGSGWGPNTVCVQALDHEDEGYHGVCPCVRVEIEGERVDVAHGEDGRLIPPVGSLHRKILMEN